MKLITTFTEVLESGLGGNIDATKGRKAEKAKKLVWYPRILNPSPITNFADVRLSAQIRERIIEKAA